MPDEAVSLRDLRSFGKGGAEYDRDLMQYFLQTDTVDLIERGDVFVVLGRKGTGKTALVRHFDEAVDSYPISALDLQSYPWALHASRRDLGVSEVDAYTVTWAYVLAVKFASLALMCDSDSESKPAADLRQYLRSNYGALDPSLADILQKDSLRLESLTVAPSLAGFEAGSITLSSTANPSAMGTELGAVNAALCSSAGQLGQAAGVEQLMVHLDGLDQGMQEVDDERKLLLIGLISAAANLQLGSREQSCRLNPVVYLRTDLWDALDFADKNKVRRSASVELAWSENDLRKLIDARLDSLLKKGVTWDDVHDSASTHHRRPKFGYVIDRTQLRPRDVLEYLNTALKRAKGREQEPLKFINQDLYDARDEYSQYLYEEFNDEIGPHWPEWKQALNAVKQIATLTFERSDFIEAYEPLKADSGGFEADEVLDRLHRYGVIGFLQSGGGSGGSEYAFRHTHPRSVWAVNATRLKVHPGLKECLGLRESRTTSAVEQIPDSGAEEEHQ